VRARVNPFSTFQRDSPRRPRAGRSGNTLRDNLRTRTVFANRGKPNQNRLGRDEISRLRITSDQRNTCSPSAGRTRSRNRLDACSERRILGARVKRDERNVNTFYRVKNNTFSMTQTLLCDTGWRLISSGPPTRRKKIVRPEPFSKRRAARGVYQSRFCKVSSSACTNLTPSGTRRTSRVNSRRHVTFFILFIRLLSKHL